MVERHIFHAANQRDPDFLGRIECKPGCVFVFSFSKDIFYCVMLPLVIKPSTGKKFWVWKKKKKGGGTKQSDKQTNKTNLISLQKLHCALWLSRTVVHLSLSLTAEGHNARLHVLSSFQYFLLKPVSSARDIASVSVLHLKHFSSSFFF